MNDPDALLGIPGASAGLWWRHTPSWEGARTGCIGRLHAESETAAAALLDRACAELAAQGCTAAVGPMDRDTWHSYRVVTATSDEPPFPGEPATDPRWAGWLESQGFAVISGYTSSRISLTDRENPQLARARDRLRSAGVTLRPLVLTDWDAELARIHEVSLTAFRQAFLYAPLEEAGFRALYEAGRALADPRWIRVAGCEGRPVGFVFAFRLPGRSALYVKTLAVLPERRFAGLGSVLLEEVQRAALADGCTHAVHCLQHEANTSLRVSQRYQPEVIRRYSLFARRLPVSLA